MKNKYNLDDIISIFTRCRWLAGLAAISRCGADDAHTGDSDDDNAAVCYFCSARTPYLWYNRCDILWYANLDVAMSCVCLSSSLTAWLFCSLMSNLNSIVFKFFLASRTHWHCLSIEWNTQNSSWNRNFNSQTCTHFVVYFCSPIFIERIISKWLLFLLLNFAWVGAVSLSLSVCCKTGSEAKAPLLP